MHGISLQRPMTNGFPAIDPADLIADCQLLDLDILAVQEIDQFQQRSGNIDQAALIAEHTGLNNYQFEPTVLGNPDDGKKAWQSAAGNEFDQLNFSQSPRYGIGLFTRYQVLKWHKLDLPAAKITSPIAIPGPNGKPKIIWITDEPRIVVAAELLTEFGPILVANTHLSFVPGKNIKQLRLVQSWLAQFELPKILLGDLNLPASWLRLLTSWQRTATTPTFPINKPKVQFDHILSMPPILIEQTHSENRIVGDHLMLKAMARINS